MALQIFEQQAMALGRLFTIAANFTDQPGHGDHPKALYGKNTNRVRDLFKIRVHLFFQTCDKAILVCNHGIEMLDFQNDALFAFTNAHRGFCGFKQLLSTLATQFASADFFDHLGQIINTQFNNAFRSCVMFEQIGCGFGGHIFHNAQKLREDYKNQMLKLIEHRGARFQGSFPAVGQTAQLGCRTFGHHQRQGMAQADNISNDPRIFAGFSRRAGTLRPSLRARRTPVLQRPHVALRRTGHAGNWGANRVAQPRPQQLRHGR